MIEYELGDEMNSVFHTDQTRRIVQSSYAETLSDDRQGILCPVRNQNTTDDIGIGATRHLILELRASRLGLALPGTKRGDKSTRRRTRQFK